MTETRDSAVNYQEITDRAFALSNLIHTQMAHPDVSSSDERWQELHDLSKAASAIFGTAMRYRGRQLREDAELDKPVPYLPASTPFGDCYSHLHISVPCTCNGPVWDGS